jgi:porphobilinogen synthase
MFPVTRMRRLRRSAPLRALVRETTLSPSDLISPIFVTHGQDRREPIASMPGVERLSVDHLAAEARMLVDLGIPATLIFGIPAHKDERGSGAYAHDGIAQQAIRAIKEAAPNLLVITDVCLCEYTDHGHCGVLAAEGNRHTPAGYLLNDATLELLAATALSHAAAGADMVAPSAMVDGMVGTIRAALDGDGFTETPVLSYAVKYASAFYGPFREAAQGAPKYGDRKSHQMDPGNVREALREAALDVAEGADMLMVKPALAYLDVIRRVREAQPDIPLLAYNVSGEYAMLKAAIANGWLGEAAILETLTSIKRAGADAIITYHAKEVAGGL